MNESSKPSNSNQEQSRQRLKRWGFRLLLLLALAVIIVLGVAGIALQDITQPTPIDPTVLALATSLLHSATPSLNPSETAQLETASPLPLRDPIEGTLFYSARPDGYSHLFAYGTGESVPVQLTFGHWDDRDPAVHPDGNSIAFSSNRDGYWDLYVLDLSNGEVRQLTQTPGYEGHPTWSPDGRWVAYEAHDGDNFDVWILPMDPGQTVFQLTNNLASDTSPAWDPNGR
ncbi:MAG: TolB family protein, partial [Anaerolineales bacterium]